MGALKRNTLSRLMRKMQVKSALFHLDQARFMEGEFFMSIKAVLFDMDGTLVDSEKVSIAAWKLAAQILNIDLPDRVIRRFIGCNFPTNRATILDHLNGDEQATDELMQTHLREFLRLADEELELKPGAREALAALREMGLPLAVATSTSRVRAIPRLERFGLQDAFKSVICGDEIKNGKPAPDIFLASAASLGVDPADCAVIEDSFNGVRSGHAAGSKVFMVPDILEPTDEIGSLCTAVLPSLFELPAAIEAAR